MTLETALRIIDANGYIADIGQFNPDTKRALERLTRNGRLRKWRGYWNTGTSLFGIGPLKTCYGQ